jgi:SAM-dependent methyltransferase
MFNELSTQKADHSISGWSSQGLKLRMQAYFQVLPQLSLGDGARVLDLGCGAGSYSRTLDKAGYQVFGVDFAHLVALEARKRTPHGNVHYLAADACSLPLPDACVDHVLCIGLLQSLHNHKTALSEICRVLKPGGSLCLMTLNSRNFKVRLDRCLGRQDIVVARGRAQPRLTTYDPDDLVRDLEEAGLFGLTVKPVMIYPQRWSRFEPLFRFLSHIPVAGFLTARSSMIIGFKDERQGKTESPGR